jgi:hypothetical protein
MSGDGAKVAPVEWSEPHSQPRAKLLFPKLLIPPAVQGCCRALKSTNPFAGGIVRQLHHRRSRLQESAQFLAREMHVVEMIAVALHVAVVSIIMNGNADSQHQTRYDVSL